MAVIIPAIKNMNQLVPDAKIAIVIDMPSREDETAGKLMQNKAAIRWTGILSGMGILPGSYSVLTLYHKYQHKKIVKGPKNKGAAQELLQRELAKLDPNVIVALGDEALELLTLAEDSKKFRGSVLDCSINDAKVLCMQHPSVLYTNIDSTPIVYWDCEKLKRHSMTKSKLNKDCKIHITKDTKLLREVFLSPEFLNDPDSLLSFDIECFQGELTAIGFAKDINTAYVIPLMDMQGLETALALKFIAEVLETPVKKVAQNGNFDIFYMGYYYKARVRGFWWDTMLAHHACYANQPKGLDFLSSIHTEEPYWKDEGKIWDPKKIGDHTRFFNYNGKDACNTLEIALEQVDMLEARETMHIFRQEMDLCYPLIAAELRGVHVNFEHKKVLYEKNLLIVHNLCFFLSALLDGNLHNLPKEERAKMDKKKLIQSVGMNINSPKQMKEYLYGACKLPKRVFKGKLTTNKDALLSLIPHDPPLMQTIMYMRDYGKRDTYYNMKIDTDSRVRATFKPGGTQTGRLSSSKSIIGTGFNMQNIPKEIRVFFESDPGKTLVQVDYGKAESWIVAYLARDQKMLDALAGADFHSTNAENILGKPVTKANYTDRQLGKRISHAANYGMTAFLLQKVLLRDGYAFSKTQCQHFLDLYFDAYPRLKSTYHPWVMEQLKRDRTITNAFGRKITFWDFWGDRLFNKAFAYYPQSTVGDLTNKALVNIYKNAPAAGFDDVEIMIQVHDSVVMQIPDEQLTDGFIDFVKEQMAVEMVVRNSDPFTIGVDVECGRNWLQIIDFDKWQAGERPDNLATAMMETFEEEEEEDIAI